MRSVSFAIAALAAVGLATPNARRYENYEVHERRSETSAWVKRGRVHPDVKLPMRIGMIQSNADNIDEMLMEVSHPDSARYGKHYTEQEVIELFAPAEEAVDSVRSWLHATGVTTDRISISVNKQWIQFDAKTSEAEALFNTKYHFYEHASSGASTIASDEYHLPGHIREHIDYITPGIKTVASTIRSTPSGEIEKRSAISRRGFKPRPPLVEEWPKTRTAFAAANLSSCSTIITPACIRALYKIPEAKSAVKGNELGIFEDLGDYYDQQDLNSFFTMFYPRIPNGTHPKLDLIDGAVAPTTDVPNAGLESLLDFQISYPIIWPQNSVLYQTDDPVYEAAYTFEGFLNNLFDAIDGSYCSFSAFGETGNSPVDPPYPDPSNQPGAYKGSLQCGKYKATNVISISYGGAESDLSISYQRRQCLEIAKLGLQGHSVVVSSGDSGVEGEGGDPTPSECLGEKGNVFAPQFPATCPYITVLGSTFLPTGADVNADAEISTTRFPSGGGFSNIYAQPLYQLLAVQKYLLEHNPPYPAYYSVDNSSFGAHGGIYNRAGRGYPDFAAIGDRVAIYGQGRPRLIGGTSASAPTFASILTRINDERLRIGKSTVGFVNPVLYANPGVLHDITNGSNPGCGTPGFSAVPGWDPVSGYGTPKYPDMLKLFLSLP